MGPIKTSNNIAGTRSINRECISTIGLGRKSVSSERRVPRPPAKSTTFINNLYSVMCKNSFKLLSQSGISIPSAVFILLLSNTEYAGRFTLEGYSALVQGLISHSFAIRPRSCTCLKISLAKSNHVIPLYTRRSLLSSQ